MYRYLSAAWGFIIWLAATGALRDAGHLLFQNERQWVVIVTFIATVPVIALATYPIYALLRLRGSERVIAAALMALPGMLLDTLSVVFFARAFPNIDPALDGVFAAWLLWAYALTLITGFWPSKPEARRAA
jgi:biotin transporter BioY